MIQRIAFILLCFFPVLSSAQGDFISSLTLKGYINKGDNAFWGFQNTNGLVSQKTIGLGILTSEYATFFGNEHRFLVGGSLYYSINTNTEDDAALNEYFTRIEYYKLKITLGAINRPEKLLGISSVNGDILWGNNARAIPGVLLGTREPIAIFKPISLEGEIGNYWLNDPRVVKNANIHYKQLTMHLEVNDNADLSFGVYHYAQYGGDREAVGLQKTKISDFAKIFVGNGGGTNVVGSDQTNNLANHIGSYHLSYQYNFDNKQLNFYYQTIFENSSGLKLKNFPDGVWGLLWSMADNTYIKGVLYEYSQTNSLTGSDPSIQYDDYFNNGTYRSGWTYFDRTIGLPFITPDYQGEGIINNLINAHHIGITGSIGRLNYKVKESYVHNYGLNTLRYNPPETVLYSHVELLYQTENLGRFGLRLSNDFSDTNLNKFTLGLEFKYQIGEDSRIRNDCGCVNPK